MNHTNTWQIGMEPVGEENSLSYRHGAIPTVPYTAGAPSVPLVHLPYVWSFKKNQEEYMKIIPIYENTDPTLLNSEDFAIVTRGHKEQLAKDCSFGWTYHHRRQAQPVLDFLYLGPSTLARDRHFLSSKGITMLLAVRDSRQVGARLMANESLVRELGIEAEYIDVAGHNELMHAFPSAVSKINDHMLKTFNQQRPANADVQMRNGETTVRAGKLEGGRVLVFCETGNERSAAVAIAYLMSLFGLSLPEAVQFVSYKRFSVSLTEELRYMLKVHEDLLVARRIVNQCEIGSSSVPAKPTSTKRGLSATVDEDGDESMDWAQETRNFDFERFNNRPAFVPFVDVDT
ncbi:phosphatases II [Hypoxylon sp. FL1284]|nr:phosphatases II [Hypoxylon sp. FL1284]